MLFDFCFDCVYENKEGVSTSDWVSIGISAINLILVIVVFRHQKNREKDDRNFQRSALSQSYKHNWFKEIIILPKIEVLNNHFHEIGTICEKLRENGLTKRQLGLIDKKLKAEFREFSKDFIEMLYAVNDAFADEIQIVSDSCLDKIQKEIYSPSKSLSDDINYKKFIIDEIKTYRNQVLSRIYNYENN